MVSFGAIAKRLPPGSAEWPYGKTDMDQKQYSHDHLILGHKN